MIKNHFTATGIVFNDDGNVLMVKHKKFGKWLPPGGHIEENELPCDAVLREIFEETGVKARVVSATFDTDSMVEKRCKELPVPLTIQLQDIEGDGSHNHIDMIYLCRAENSALKPQENEIDGVGWFSPSQVIDELETFENIRSSVGKAEGMVII
ncbi:MAG: NUDIX domain-containing protein [Clostridiales bacterium]|jgi:ADP-ribose pyrophosphatase YjhB (NUDIX family)|nr:NUDIX domain-containing protein [Clostridiales bacterium]